MDQRGHRSPEGTNIQKMLHGLGERPAQKYIFFGHEDQGTQ